MGKKEFFTFKVVRVATKKGSEVYGSRYLISRLYPLTRSRYVRVSDPVYGMRKCMWYFRKYRNGAFILAIELITITFAETIHTYVGAYFRSVDAVVKHLSEFIEFIRNELKAYSPLLTETEIIDEVRYALTVLSEKIEDLREVATLLHLLR
ncbi:MAG: hypothetical protein DRJ40_11625 [Thermoprotei archaeon]|nr:MAG: hypothetical protein DRJ40_11625 [Thermoprotei archaeon]